MNKILLYLLSTLLFFSCKERIFEYPTINEVWIPRYADKDDSKVIELLPPQESKFSGKIYVYNDYIFQIEENRGIHVYLFEDILPEKIGFIKVIGAQEISIRAYVLYTNNMNDLVAIDISDIENIKEIERLPDMFHIATQDLPPVRAGYYECVDPSKGYIVSWDLVKDTLGNCKLN